MKYDINKIVKITYNYIDLTVVLRNIYNYYNDIIDFDDMLDILIENNIIHNNLYYMFFIRCKKDYVYFLKRIKEIRKINSNMIYNYNY